MNIDAQNILRNKILLLQKYLKMLKPYLAIKDDELLHNNDKRLAMERVFQLVVDESIDINGILAYQLGGTIPDSLKSSFFEIVPLDIIDHNFALQIAESAKIRNQLTHDYEKLTDSEIVASIRKFHVMYLIYEKILVDKFVAPSC